MESRTRPSAPSWRPSYRRRPAGGCCQVYLIQ